MEEKWYVYTLQWNPWRTTRVVARNFAEAIQLGGGEGTATHLLVNVNREDEPLEAASLAVIRGK